MHLLYNLPEVRKSVFHLWNSDGTLHNPRIHCSLAPPLHFHPRHTLMRRHHNFFFPYLLLHPDMQ